MKNTLIKLAQAILRKLEEPSEVKKVNLQESQSGVIGDYANIEGGIHINNINTMIENMAAAPSRDPAAVLDIYRYMLMKAHRHLPLRGVNIGDSDPSGNQSRLELNQVYVALDTRMHIDLTVAEKATL